MQKTVLVVDDSNTIRKAFEMTFMGIDEVKILTSSGPSEAKDIASKQPPDLIIADSRLGDLSGYDFCRQLKEIEALKQVPVWIMTGPFERLDDQKYIECGAEGHIRKPFDTQRIIDKVLAMSAPPEEEKARPSYPAGVSTRAVVPVKPAQPPPVSIGSQPFVKVPPKTAASSVSVPPVSKPDEKQTAQQSGRSATLQGVIPASPAQQVKPRRQPTMIGTPVSPQIRAKMQAPPSEQPRPATPAQVQPPEVRMGEEEAGKRLMDEVEEIKNMKTYQAFVETLDQKQREQFMTIIREVIEKVAWEVVPDLAESIIKEELDRLLKE